MGQQEYAIYQLRRGESVYQSAVSRRLDFVILQRHLIAKTWFIVPKYEARNPKFETRSNVQNPNFQNKTLTEAENLF